MPCKRNYDRGKRFGGKINRHRGKKGEKK